MLIEVENSRDQLTVCKLEHFYKVFSQVNEMFGRQLQALVAQCCYNWGNILFRNIILDNYFMWN